MAATIATAIGVDKSGRVKETHRLGSDHATARAATWRTFGVIMVGRDGSGFVEVKRDGVTIVRFDFESEDYPQMPR